MKWLIRILFLVVAAFGLVIGALLLMPGDKLATILAEQVKAQTGRDLKLSGDVKLSFWPILGMETGPVTFGNAPWAGGEPMLSAQSLAVGVEASALLSGDIRIKRVLADGPVLRLERSEARGNWELHQPGNAEVTGAAAQEVESRPVTLERLELTNARLIYVEDGTVSMDFSNVDLSARWPDVTDPMEMQAKMPVPGGAVEVDLTIPDLPAFSSGKVTPLELSLNAPGGDIQFSGRVNLTGEMDGKTTVTANDTHKMLAAFGQAGVSVPEGLGQTANVSGQMTYTSDGRIALRDMTAVLDHNRLDGDVDIQIASPPQITARLKTGNLDLSKAAGGETSGSGSGASDGWSRQPIDASFLALANGSVRLQANSIAVPGLQLGPSDLTLSLDRSRAVLEMHPASLFAGHLNGQVVANNRNGLSVGGNLKADNIDLKEALSMLGDIERLSGIGSGTLEFLGIGQTEEQIMNSLSGKGSIEVDEGVIGGVDLDRIMGRGKGTGGTTLFNSLTASFTMQDGDLYNDDLLMQLDNFRADGEGRVGLGARDIDYLFTPVALRANSGKGIAIPVRITGPWSDPSIRPNIAKVLEAAAEGRVRELEDEAKNKVLKRVGDKLDSKITDTDQVEDALKKKLEDEAKKGFLKLLGQD